MTTEAEKTTLITTPVRARPPSDEAVTVQARNPGEMMVLAIQHGVDPEVLKKLMDLQREWEAQQARKAYVEAMTEFKRECPAVLNRDATVDFTSNRGRTHYRHATLGGIVTAITPMLSKNGLSVSFETTQKDSTVSVTCNVTHRAGHRESTTLIGPRDESGNKNMIQAVGSAVTYLQRYTLLSALGLATADQDDDGFTADVASRGKSAPAASDILARKQAPADTQKPTQQPDPGDNQERPEPNVVRGEIEEISVKTSKEVDERTKEPEWIKYGVKIKGEFYGTFDKTHGQVAKDAKENGQAVEIEWQQHGKYKNLVGIHILAE